MAQAVADTSSRHQLNPRFRSARKREMTAHTLEMFRNRPTGLPSFLTACPCVQHRGSCALSGPCRVFFAKKAHMVLCIFMDAEEMLVTSSA